MRYTISLATASVLACLVTPAAAEVPRVITDIPPVQALVAQVMADLGAPVLLLDKGADAHSFQLRPSQAAALAEADLVVWIGPEMTPWLDRAVGGLAPDVGQLRLEGGQQPVVVLVGHHADQPQLRVWPALGEIAVVQDIDPARVRPEVFVLSA